jgi:Dynamin family
MPTAYGDWARSLPPLLESLTVLLPEQARAARDAIMRVQMRVATVTFGGRFKSGKSSLVNAALGRRLLPTKDLPETGANCYLMHGPRDEATLVAGLKRTDITCTAEAISQAISLRGGQEGLKRAAAVQRVELRLKDFPGGSYCRWIDPPGLFDRPEMSERAWASARDSDVLVWVFNSQQFLGEAEAEALARLIAERGSASVAFVENAFLNGSDVESWDYHLREIAAVNHDKLRSLAELIGLPRSAALDVTVVSAERIASGDGGFGRGALQALLRRMVGPDSPRIRLARLQWAQRALQRAALAARAAYTPLKASNDAHEQQLIAESRTSAQRQSRLAVAVNQGMVEYFAELELAAVGCARIVAEQVTSEFLPRDSTFSERLNGQLHTAAEALIEELNTKIDREAVQLGLRPLDGSARAVLRRLLKPPSVTVAVADNRVDQKSVAASAAAGAVSGAWFFGVGAIPGALIAGGLSAFIGSKAAVEKDVVETRTNVAAAAVAAIQAMQPDERKTAEVRRIVLERYMPSARTPVPAAVDRRRESDLLALLTGLEAAAAQAAELARKEGAS